MKEIASVIRGTSNDMEFMSTKYNRAGVHTFTEGLAAWEQGQQRDGSLEHLNQVICSVFHYWEGRGQIANDIQLIQSPAGTMLMRLLVPYSYEQRGLGTHTHTCAHTHTHTLLFCYVCFHYH